MDYEKKYNDALERAKKLRDKLKYSSSSDAALAVTELAEIFPELAESEDEKIRKFLIGLLSSGTWREDWPFSPVECVAWLEKMKDAIPYDKYVMDIATINKEAKTKYQEGWNDCYDSIKKETETASTSISIPSCWEEKQKEISMPNSTELIEMWDNEKKMLEGKDFRGDEWRLAYNAFMDGFSRGTCVKFEKQQENPKSSDSIPSYCTTNAKCEDRWHKVEDSPKEQQPAEWKPSDVQISALHAIINDADNAGSEYCQLVIKSLYEDLQKL